MATVRSPIYLRDADHGEAGAIADASRLHVEYALPVAWTTRRIKHAIADEATRVLVADAAGDIAGFAIARCGEHALHVMLLGVLPRYRRQRVGARLLDALERDAAAAGLRTARLELRSGNHGARRFYHGRGYWLLGVRALYYGNGEAAAVMARVL